jgi:hypothetical protein
MDVIHSGVSYEKDEDTIPFGVAERPVVRM